MNFRTLFTPAALAGLLALPGAASALDAIPASCLKCRQAPDDTAFITCLYECLADLKTAPGASSGDASKSKAGTPSADSGKSGKKTQADGLPAFEGGWTVYDRPDAAEGDQAVHLSGVVEVFQHQLEGLDHDLHTAKPVGGIEVVFRVAAARGDRNVVDRRGKRRLVREACNVHGDDLAVKLPLHAFLEEFIFAALGIKRTERYNMLHAIRLISPLRLP